MAGFLQTQERQPKREEHGEHLLPGIPDDITLNHIVTKLPWGTLHILPSLCRVWEVAIRRRQVYDARVFQNATETLVLHFIEKQVDARETDHRIEKRVGAWETVLALYSIRDKSSYLLPVIPNVELGIPMFCQYVVLEGKIYVLGGVHRDRDIVYSHCGSEKVYVLDLVGRRHWKECASMREPRKRFGCGVVDGKIYVIGISEDDQGNVSEVYDPKKDAWSPIMSIPFPHASDNIVTLGEELIVNSSLYYSTHSDVYHPVKNEWRRLEHFESVVFEEISLLVANGKLYGVKLHRYPTRLQIYVYSMDSDLWTYLHRSSLAEHYGLPPDFAIRFWDIQALDDELLAFVWLTRQNGTCEKFFLQSKGLGGENEQIAWEKVELPLNCKLVSPLPGSVKL